MKKSILLIVAAVFIFTVSGVALAALKGHVIVGHKNAYPHIKVPVASYPKV